MLTRMRHGSGLKTIAGQNAGGSANVRMARRTPPRAETMGLVDCRTGGHRRFDNAF